MHFWRFHSSIRRQRGIRYLQPGAANENVTLSHETSLKSQLSVSPRIPSSLKSQLSTSSRIPSSLKSQLSTSSRIPNSLYSKPSISPRIPKLAAGSIYKKIMHISKYPKCDLTLILWGGVTHTFAFFHHTHSLPTKPLLMILLFFSRTPGPGITQRPLFTLRGIKPYLTVIHSPQSEACLPWNKGL